MNLKNYIKKKLKKDNTQFLLRIYENKDLYTTEKINLTKLSKYLKTNEKIIERVNIKLISN